MSSARGLLDITAVTRTMVSPKVTVTLPWAWLANLPVSMVSVLPPIWVETDVGLAISVAIICLGQPRNKKMRNR